MTPTKVEAVAVDSISTHPQNARQGDVGAIAESLERHGQYRPIVVQKSTGYVLAGNHTLLAARALGWPTIEILRVDVDDEEALRILLVDNRASDLASYDDSALLGVLRELASTPLSLAGTGYDSSDLDDLLVLVNGYERGLPTAPPDFPDVGDGIETTYRCPSCQYEWSGDPKP